MNRTSVGIILAVCGNCLISCSLNAQKYAHMLKERNPEAYAGSYLRIKWWWIGMAMMAFGELGNFLAFGFAPASLVSPLGGVSVVANAFISSRLLGEVLLPRHIFGTFLALCGGVVIVLFSAKENPNIDLPYLLHQASATEFIAFLVVIASLTIILMFLPKRFGDKYLLVHISICSLLGCITVMACKAVSLSIFLTTSGDNQFKYPLIYVLIVIAAASIVLQIRHLNKAMMLFGTSQVVPVYYVLFTTSSIMGGMILYKEFSHSSLGRILGFASGCCLTFIGVFAINSKRAQQDPSAKVPEPQQSNSHEVNMTDLEGIEGKEPKNNNAEKENTTASDTPTTMVRPLPSYPRLPDTNKDLFLCDLTI